MAGSVTPEAIDLILGLAPAKMLAIGGFTYIDKDRKVELFSPPVPDDIVIHTLSGFVALLESGFEAFNPLNCVVQVSAYNRIDLLSKYSDAWGRRQLYIACTALKPEREFNFNTYMPQESFNIALRSMFVQDDPLDELVALAGNIAKQTEIRQEDDGFAQSVSKKDGTFLVKEVTVKPRVTLRPFRTFLEVDQPEGDFIFRVKNDERLGNLCALFEADGGGWKLTAMDTIKAWLKQQISTSTVEAITGLPVIA